MASCKVSAPWPSDSMGWMRALTTSVIEHLSARTGHTDPSSLLAIDRVHTLENERCSYDVAPTPPEIPLTLISEKTECPTTTLQPVMLSAAW